MIIYEQLLDRNLDWALREGSMHFERESAVYKSLHKIAQRLDALGIPYAVVGGMAMATFLGVFFIPVLYVIFASSRKRRADSGWPYSSAR